MMSVMPGGLDGRLTVRRQLAGSLVAFESWAAANDFEAEELRDLFEHMWKWLTVEPSNFMDWHDWDSELLRTCLNGRALPDLVLQYCSRHGIDSGNLHGALAALVGCVYDNLFGAFDLDRTPANFSLVDEFLAAHHVWPPAASLFGRITDEDFERGHWGAVLGGTDPIEWQRLGRHLVPDLSPTEWSEIDAHLFAGERMAAIASLQAAFTQRGNSSPLRAAIKVCPARFHHLRAVAADRFAVPLDDYWNGVHT
jgi:hypothetical protein